MPRRVRITWPSSSEVSEALESIRSEMETADEAELEVRLQVLPNGDWEIWTGHPSYDTDHRGYWGIGLLEQEASALEIRELARDLIEEARGDWEASE